MGFSNIDIDFAQETLEEHARLSSKRGAYEFFFPARRFAYENEPRRKMAARWGHDGIAPERAEIAPGPVEPRVAVFLSRLFCSGVAHGRLPLELPAATTASAFAASVFVKVARAAA